MRKILLTLLVGIAFVLSATAQDRVITGKVTDPQGNPVSNVSVLARGTAIGTQTNSDGTFRISVPASVNTLTFSAVDFETQSAAIRGTAVNVSLISKTTILEDVIVTGYGRVKRSQYSGAVERVSREATKNVAVASVDQGLQGRVAGMTVLSTSGQPGSPANVTIRGLTSIIGTNTPLYIIDGIPTEAGVFQSLNTNDIESVDVLKDATAAALYGSRGAAGVIVITTRRGTGNKLKISTSSQFGITQPPTSDYRMMNAKELLQAQEDLGVATNQQGNLGAIVFGWNTSPKNPAYIAATPAQKAALDRVRDSVGNINTNWDDIFFRQGKFMRQDITLSGGTGKTRLYSNFSFYNEEGITDRTDLKRYTWRNNADYSDDRFTMQFSSNIGYTKRNFQESTTSNNLRNPFLSSRLTPSTVALWKPGQENSGDYINGLAVGTGNHFAGANLYQLNKMNENYSDQIKVLLSNNLTYKISEHFSANGLFGADYRQTQSSFYSDPREWYNTSSGDIRIRSGSMAENLDRFASLQLRGGLTYNQTFSEKHEVELSGYAEVIKNYLKTTNLTAYGIDPRRPNTIAGTTPGTVQNQLVPVFSGSRSQRAIVSQIALAKYSYNKKYTITGSFRNDGASSLPKDNRFRNFYSVGAIWEASKETFIQNANIFGSLRVRASYGTSANADNFPLDNFGYIPSYTVGTDGGGLPTQSFSNVGNLDASWEYTRQANLGVDFDVWKNRVYGSVDVYNKQTKGTFATRQVSQTTGFTGYRANTSTVLNKGIELKLNFDVLRNANTRITLYANGSYNKNEVTDLGGLPDFQNGTSLVSVGKPLGTQWEVGWAGVEPATGRPLYYDLNGNITTDYSTNNRTLDWGTYFAPYQGGFGLNGVSHGFDFQVHFTWQEGSKRYNNLEFFVENPASFLAAGLNQAASLNFWKGPGDVDATTQSPLYPVNFSSKYIQDASFLKLKNVTLGYTIPAAKLVKSKIVSSFRFYASALNVYAWTKWKGYDPEDDNNISLSEFPNPRTFTAGLDITF